LGSLYKKAFANDTERIIVTGENIPRWALLVYRGLPAIDGGEKSA
jgi:hypothetical protein